MKRIKRQNIEIYHNENSHVHYWGLIDSGKLLLQYIDTYHPYKNITVIKTDRNSFDERYYIWGKINNQCYSPYYIFEKLHKSLNTRYFSGDELISVYDMRVSKCASTQIMATSLIMQMSLDYLPFVKYISTSHNTINYFEHYAHCKDFDYNMRVETKINNCANQANEKRYKKYRKEMMHFFDYRKTVSKWI